MEFSNYSNLIYQHDPDIAPAPVGEIPWYVTIVFVILGTTGNILVCLAVALDKTLQTLTNLFLCSLAFTDLVISLMILPARRVMMLTGKAIFVLKLVVYSLFFQPSIETFPVLLVHIIRNYR